MRHLPLLFILLAGVCFAEAGLPNTFCGEQSCACVSVTCSCGQVCNANQQRCDPAQAGFCTGDSQCAGSCGPFICEGNVCVRGTRDGGSIGPDGGTGGQHDGGTTGQDGGTCGTRDGGGGCASAGAGLSLLALLIGARVLRRRTAR